MPLAFVFGQNEEGEDIAIAPVRHGEADNLAIGLGHPAAQMARLHVRDEAFGRDADGRHLLDREVVLRHRSADAGDVAHVRSPANADHSLTGTV